jgi:hypothetical protein
MRIPVRALLSSGSTHQMYLYYTSKGPKLLDIEEHEEIDAERVIEFSIDDDAICRSASIKQDERIEFNSCLYPVKYSSKPKSQFELYPPSTRGWFTYLTHDGFDAIIVLQKFRSSSKYLMSAIDVATDSLLRLHAVRDFEASVLQMESDWDLYNRLFVDLDESAETSISDSLEAPAPSWKQIAKLTEGVDIHNLKRLKTVRETFEQFIPRTFPVDVREQVMAFLAWTTSAKVPVEDPLDFLAHTSRQYRSGAITANLIFGHIQCLIQGIPPPQYVRIMALADRGSLKRDLRPLAEEAELDPWDITWYRLAEMFPDRRGRVLDIVHSLNRANEVHLGIPISRRSAKKSREAWLDRFSLIRSNLYLRGYVQDARLGLTKLVYIGGAHRWPHKHLQYAARLGAPNQKAPYIQVLLMPKIAVDRTMRMKQNFAPIDWTASRVNYGLYMPKLESWKNNLSYIESSLSRNRTKKQLDKEFDLSSSAEISMLTQDDAKILDFMFWGINNQSFELGYYDEILPLGRQRLEEKITSFIQSGIMNFYYLLTIYGLASVCLEIRGEIPQLYSIARSSLLHFPTATAMVSESSNLCVVMARVPEERAYDVLAKLPSKAGEYNIQMKSYRVSAYVGYVNNLYQRLLLPGGSWDNDISGLLSQIRS